MERLAAGFERATVAILMSLLMATILFGTAATAWSLAQDLLNLHELVAEPRVLFSVFGSFVAVLVGVELLKILRYILIAHEIDTTLVAQTALMALCNKVITMNLTETPWTVLVGVAALLGAIAAAIHALRRRAQA